MSGVSSVDLRSLCASKYLYSFRATLLFASDIIPTNDYYLDLLEIDGLRRASNSRKGSLQYNVRDIGIILSFSGCRVLYLLKTFTVMVITMKTTNMMNSMTISKLSPYSDAVYLRAFLDVVFELLARP